MVTVLEDKVERLLVGLGGKVLILPPSRLFMLNVQQFIFIKLRIV